MPKVREGHLSSGPQTLKTKLQSKSRARRGALTSAAAASATLVRRRNDLRPMLRVTEVSLADLRAPARVLRKIDPAHVREVANSIATLGFCVPVLLGAENVVLDGWARVEAAKSLGLTHAPCIHMEHLSAKDQRMLRLAVNRLAEKGEWDLDELKIEFEELMLDDTALDFTGFDPLEIDQILLDPGSAEAEPDQVTPQAGSTPVVRVGDLFALGSHRILCGDATQTAVWQRLMEGAAPARLVLTDEPYNVKIQGHVTGGAHREFVMGSGEMTDAEFLAFNLAWIAPAAANLCDGGLFATFIDWRGYPTVHAACVGLGLDPLNLIVWAKTNAAMGSLYRSQHELWPLFKKGTAPHVNNVELGKHGRWRSNLWTYPGASSLGSDARRGLEVHPTVKPTAMLEDALLDLTRRGDLVLDPFLGSGSTLLACEKTGRSCRGLELDPLYVDVIIRRFQAVTGTDAVLLETGQTFASVAALRGAEAAI